MKFLFEKRFVISFMFLYTLVFSIHAFLNSNYEFLYYAVLIILLIIYIYKKQHALWLSNKIIVGLAIIGLLHFAGGTLYIDGTRLYDLSLMAGIHYDNVVHAFAMFVATFVSYNLLSLYMPPHIQEHRPAFLLLIFLVTLGLGAVNEITEFMAVLLFEAGARVGDFYNTGWDFVFNTIGICAAISFLPPYKDDRIVFYYNKKSSGIKKKIEVVTKRKKPTSVKSKKA